MEPALPQMTLPEPFRAPFHAPFSPAESPGTLVPQGAAPRPEAPGRRDARPVVPREAFGCPGAAMPAGDAFAHLPAFGACTGDAIPEEALS